MGDTLKNILTHGAAALGGFYVGSKNATPAEKSKNIFSRFIPTLIIAYGITHFAINTPRELFNYLTHRDDNYTEIKKLEIEKNVGIYDDKVNKLFDKQKQLEDYFNNKMKNKSNIDASQNSKIRGIEKKLNDISYSSSKNEGKGFVPFESIENTAYNTWVVFDKTDQRFYFYKNQKLVKSGPMIFNGSGNPAVGLYTVNEVNKRSGNLFPGFIRLEGVIGISGSGQNKEYDPDIRDSNNITRNGFRVYNSDMDYLMKNVCIGTRVEVRD